MPYEPIIGGALTDLFPLQFPNSQINDMSLATTLIELLSNDGRDTVVTHATGFIWESQGFHYLVTARHVLSGRNPFDNSLMSRNGYIPHKIRFYPTFHISNDSWARIAVTESIYRIDVPRWFEDPNFDNLRMDIAVLPLNFAQSKVKSISEGSDYFSNLVSFVGFECVVLGYPQRNVGGLMTPIWRRGTFASEPLLPVDHKPMFLLDASTTVGFSGGPVFRRHIGPAPLHSEDGSIELKLERVITTQFIGVYAGRLEHAHVGGEVPFVFYGNRVPVIVELARSIL